MTVTYIPSQNDDQAASSSIPFRSSPFLLVWYDLRLVWALKAYLLQLYLPSAVGSPRSELHLWDLRNIREIGFHLILSIIPLAYITGLVWTWWWIPGSVGILYTISTVLTVHWFANFLNGEARFIRSHVPLRSTHRFRRERWVYINGMCTGKHWCQLNVDLISETFRRPVIGIHKKSYGPVIDLIECILQRCFGYASADARKVYIELKELLQEPSVDKLVVIAHSQGGIIVSNVLDMLFADLPPEIIGKLEIYTFGSAANHFNNPRCDPIGLLHHSPLHHIPHIEHYCNENDGVARFGVLHFTQQPDNRFAGKVFTRLGVRGHLFNQHYLAAMFPIRSANSDYFLLDQTVEVEELMVAFREGPQFLREKHLSWQVSKVAVSPISGTPPVKRVVRQVSRLWMYRNGGCPTYE